MRNLFVFLTTLILHHTTLFAAPVFGPPSFLGTACSTHTSVSWALSPDNSSLSILFNEFLGNSPKFCSIRVPLNIQNQTQILADYRGFHDLSNQTYLNHQVDYKLDEKLFLSQKNLEPGPDTNMHFYEKNLSLNCNHSQILELFVQNFLTGSSINNSFYTLDSIDLMGIASKNMPAICSRASSILSIPILIITLLFTIFY